MLRLPQSFQILTFGLLSIVSASYADKDLNAAAPRAPVSQASNQDSLGNGVNTSFDRNVKKDPIDILVVIDNSVSMIEEQTNLSSKMDDLLASIVHADWQIGIITTSALLKSGQPGTSYTDYSCAMTVIKASEGDTAKVRFQAAINAGASGSRIEQGILQSVVGLACPEAAWIRKNSTLAVLIVSDEDNCSFNGEDCLGLFGENEDDLFNFIETNLGYKFGVNAGFYGIFSQPNAPCFTSTNEAIAYQRLILKTKGKAGNICDASYSEVLNAISADIATLAGKSSN